MFTDNNNNNTRRVSYEWLASMFEAAEKSRKAETAKIKEATKKQVQKGTAEVKAEIKEAAKEQERITKQATEEIITVVNELKEEMGPVVEISKSLHKVKQWLKKWWDKIRTWWKWILAFCLCCVILLIVGLWLGRLIFG